MQHASDCAVHNAPAMPSGPCDCEAVEKVVWRDAEGVLALRAGPQTYPVDANGQPKLYSTYEDHMHFIKPCDDGNYDTSSRPRDMFKPATPQAVEVPTYVPSGTVDLPVTDTAAKPTYHCPVHGDIDWTYNMYNNGVEIRNWCGKCFIELLDNHCQVVKIAPKP